MVGSIRSVSRDLYDGVGEGSGCFLRQVMPDTPDDAMRSLARELAGVG